MKVIGLTKIYSYLRDIWGDWVEPPFSLRVKLMFEWVCSHSSPAIKVLRSFFKSAPAGEAKKVRRKIMCFAYANLIILHCTQ